MSDYNKMDWYPGGMNPVSVYSLAELESALESVVGYSDAGELSELANPSVTSAVTLSGKQGGRFIWDASSALGEDGINGSAGTVIKSGVVAEGRWIREYSGSINVHWFGALGDDVTDDNDAIHAALLAAKRVKSKLFFPSGKYLYGSTITLDYQRAALVGDCMNSWLKYTGAGACISYGLSSSSAQVQDSIIRDVSIVSDTASVGIDFTKSNYADISNLVINLTRPNSILVYGKGSQGLGPYYNSFSKLFFIGGGDRTQVGIKMEGDFSGRLADGPNGNLFSDLKRMASLAVAIDIESGVGNLFSNIQAESISVAMIRLNNRDYVDGGIATSTKAHELIDVTKNWSTSPYAPFNFINDSVVILNGVGAGEVRKVVSSTATKLVLDKPFHRDIGSGFDYALIKSRAVNNKFTNLRMEGVASDAPDAFQLKPGASNNQITNFEVGSIGAGAIINDSSHNSSNEVNLGSLQISSFFIKSLGSSKVLDVVPRFSVHGGIRVGSKMMLEYIELASPNQVSHSGSVIELIVDHGGAIEGQGVRSLSAVLESGNKVAFAMSGNRRALSTANNGIFVKLKSSSHAGSSDVVISIAYRVI